MTPSSLFNPFKAERYIGKQQESTLLVSDVTPQWSELLTLQLLDRLSNYLGHRERERNALELINVMYTNNVLFFILDLN